MIDSNVKISLTYQLGGERLLRKGDYTTAELSKKNDQEYVKSDGTKILIPSIVKQSKTIEQPVYSEARKHILLPNEFVQYAVSDEGRPPKPNRHSSYIEVQAFKNWNKMGNKAKITYHMNQYLKDVGAINAEWEILE